MISTGYVIRVLKQQFYLEGAMNSLDVHARKDTEVLHKHRQTRLCQIGRKEHDGSDCLGLALPSQRSVRART